MNHEVTQNTKGQKIQRQEKNLHRNNAAEWVLFAVVFPAWLGVVAWNNVRRFVPFVTSWFKN